MKPFWVEDKVYKTGVWVAIGPFEKVARWASRELKFEMNYKPRAAATLTNHVNEDESWAVKVLWMPEWKGSIDDYAALSHEVCHLAVRVLFTAGVDVGMPKAEELCYLHEFYFKEILTRLKKS